MGLRPRYLPVFLVVLFIGSAILPMFNESNSYTQQSVEKKNTPVSRIDVSGGKHYLNWTQTGDWMDAEGKNVNIDMNGNLVLANRTDDFNDNHLDTFKWRTGTSAGADLNETNQRLEMSIPSSSNNEYVFSVYDMEGDFDLSVDFNILNWGGTISESVYGFGFNVDLGPGYDQIYILRAFLGATQPGFEGSNVYQSGDLNAVGGGNSWGQTLTSDNSGSLRLKRSGTTFSAYYYDFGWQLLGSKNMGAGYDGYGAVGINLYSLAATGAYTNPYAKVAFDNFAVESGPDRFSYGHWTKDHQADGEAHLVDYEFSAITPGTTQVSAQFKVADDQGDLETADWSDWVYASSGTLPDTIPQGSWIRTEIFLDARLEPSQTTSPVLDHFSLRYSLIPDPPTLLGPEQGGWANSTPVFDWSFADPDIGDTQDKFLIQLDDVSSFLSPEYDSTGQTSSESSWAFPSGTLYSSISDGTWYWRAKVWDQHGGWSNWSATGSFSVESIPPQSVISNPANGASLPILSEIKGSASDQGGSGIAGVEIAILNGNSYWNGSAWQSKEAWLQTTGSSSWSYSDNLPVWSPDLQYTIKSRAFDGARNIQTTPTFSDFTISASGIASWITSPQQSQTYNGLPKVTGEAADTTGGTVLSVDVALLDELDQYFNGTGWSPKEHWFKANGTGEWELEITGAALHTDSVYTFISRATSSLGVIESPGEGVSFIFDDIVPKVEITWPVQGQKIHRLTYIEGTAVDEGGGYVGSVQMTIHRDANDTWWDGDSWTTKEFVLTASYVPNTQDPTTGKFIIGDSLPPIDWDTNATIRVWAVDEAGNAGEGSSGTRGTVDLDELVVEYFATKVFGRGGMSFAKTLDPMDIDTFLDMNPNPSLGDWYAWVAVISAVNGLYGGNVPGLEAKTSGTTITWGPGVDKEVVLTKWEIGSRIEFEVKIKGEIKFEIIDSSEGSITFKPQGSIEIKASGKWMVLEYPIPVTFGVISAKMHALADVSITLSADASLKVFGDGNFEAGAGIKVESKLTIGFVFGLGLNSIVSNFVAIDLEFAVMLTYGYTLYDSNGDPDSSGHSLAFAMSISLKCSLLNTKMFDLTVCKFNYDALNQAWSATGPAIELPELNYKIETRSRSEDFDPPDELPIEGEVLDWLGSKKLEPHPGSSEVLEGEFVLSDKHNDQDLFTASSPTGEMTAVWTSNPAGTVESHIKAATWDGKTWQVLPDVVSDSKLNVDPAVAYTPEGEPLVVWSRAELDLSESTTSLDLVEALPEMELVYSIYDGAAWSEPEPITDDDRPDSSPVAASDTAGNMVLLWTKEGHAESSGNLVGELVSSQVWTSSYYSDTGFTTPKRLSPENVLATSIDAAFSTENKALGVWIQGDGFDERSIGYSEFREGIWSEPKTLKSDSPTISVSLTGSSDGSFTLASVRDQDLNGTLEVRTYSTTFSEPIEVPRIGQIREIDIQDTGTDLLLVWTNYTIGNDTDIVYVLGSEGYRVVRNITSDTSDDSEPVISSVPGTPIVWVKRKGNTDGDVHYTLMEDAIGSIGTISLAADPTSLELKPGGSEIVKLSLSNFGDDPVEITITGEGIDQTWLTIPGAFTLAGRGSKDLDVNVAVPGDAAAGNYTLTLTAKGEGVVKKAQVRLSVIPEEQEQPPEDDDEPQESQNYLPLILIGAVVVIGLAALLAVMMVMRRKKEEEKAKKGKKLAEKTKKDHTSLGHSSEQEGVVSEDTAGSMSSPDANTSTPAHTSSPGQQPAVIHTSPIPSERVPAEGDGGHPYTDALHDSQVYPPQDFQQPYPPVTHPYAAPDDLEDEVMESEAQPELSEPVVDEVPEN